MSKPKSILFVPTGEPVKAGEFHSPWGGQMFVREDKSGFELGPGFTRREFDPDEAVERVCRLCYAEFCTPPDFAKKVLDAILGPSEPEPTTDDLHAARKCVDEMNASRVAGSHFVSEVMGVQIVARHIARARRSKP